MTNRPCLRVGVGGPVGSGKTALLRHLCMRLRKHYNMAVVTNDIYTREDAEFLLRHNALEADRIIGVETGRLPAHRHPRRRLHEHSGNRRASGPPPRP